MGEINQVNVHNHAIITIDMGAFINSCYSISFGRWRYDVMRCDYHAEQ